MKIRHGELANGAIHRVTVSEHEMVGLTNATVVTILLEDGHNVVKIRLLDLEVDDSGLFTLKYEAHTRKHCTFNTVSFIFTKYREW